MQIRENPKALLFVGLLAIVVGVVITSEPIIFPTQGSFKMFILIKWVFWALGCLGVSFLITWFIVYGISDIMNYLKKKSEKESNSDWIRYLRFLCEEVKYNSNTPANMYSVMAGPLIAENEEAEKVKDNSLRASGILEMNIQELVDMEPKEHKEENNIERTKDIVEILRRKRYVRPAKRHKIEWEGNPHIFITHSGILRVRKELFRLRALSGVGPHKVKAKFRETGA